MAQFNSANGSFQQQAKTLFETNMLATIDGRVATTTNPFPVTSVTRANTVSYASDAYRRQKVVQDYSIFSGEATIRIPARIWEQQQFDLTTTPVTITYQDIDSSKIKSANGMFEISSGTANNIGYALATKEFFRTQSNRGTLYSWSMQLPNPETAGARAVGPSSGQNGISLFLSGDGTNWTLYYSRVHEGIQELTDITNLLPDGFDISKGHLYDLQMAWRGVGNINLFIDEELIYTDELLGNITGVSVRDNSLPFVMAASCGATGANNVIRVGCIDISSEGGKDESVLFGSVATEGLKTIPSEGAAILALRVPRNISYNGNTVFNTRGAILDKLVSWTRSEAQTMAYYGRDWMCPNLDGLTWSNIDDSFLQYTTGNTAVSALNTAFNADIANTTLLVDEFQEQEVKNVIENPNLNSKFKLTPGDIIIIRIDPINNNVQTFATLYYSEQL